MPTTTYTIHKSSKAYLKTPYAEHAEYFSSRGYRVTAVTEGSE